MSLSLSSLLSSGQALPYGRFRILCSTIGCSSGCENGGFDEPGLSRMLPTSVIGSQNKETLSKAKKACFTDKSVVSCWKLIGHFISSDRFLGHSLGHCCGISPEALEPLKKSRWAKLRLVQ